MAMGKREAEQQQDLFVTHDKLPRSPGHVFYRKLNQLLAEGGFDRWVEAAVRAVLCRRPGPAVGAAGRVLPHAAGRLLRGDRLAARHRLAVQRFALAAGVPGHSAGRRFARPLVALRTFAIACRSTVHEAVFVWVLALAAAEEAAEGQDGGRRLHHAGSQRGDEEHRPQRHGRGLEGVPHAADEGGRRARGRTTSRPATKSCGSSTNPARTRRSPTTSG